MKQFIEKYEIEVLLQNNGYEYYLERNVLHLKEKNKTVIPSAISMWISKPYNDVYEAISKCKEINILDFTDSDGIPSYFYRFPFIEEVRIGRKGILPIFRDCPRLSRITFVSAEIQSLTGNSFDGWPHMTILSLGEKLPDSVSFAIEDCGYSSVFEVFKYQMKMMFNLPSFPFLNIAESWCKTIAKYDFHTKTSLTALAKTKIPVLFIHGTKDTFVPYQMLEENYDVCAAKKEKLIIHGAKHGASETKEPELYWKIIDKFTKKYEKKKN